MKAEIILLFDRKNKYLAAILNSNTIHLIQGVQASKKSAEMFLMKINSVFQISFVKK